MSTSATHKSKSKKLAIDRPFDASILKKAREIAAKYQVVLQEEDGEYFGRGLELPLVMGDGKTPDACVKDTRQALVVTVAYLLECGKLPPVPASEQLRSAQVNVRLTPSEKELLESTAQRKGFKGISDYARHTLISAAE